MTFLRLSGKNLVSASCGSYMWLSASNTGKESSREGMAISLGKAGFSAGGNDVTTSAQQGVPGPGAALDRSSLRPGGGQFGCRSVDHREVHGRRCEELVLAVPVNVDLHDHCPLAGSQHPGHREGRALPDRP